MIKLGDYKPSEPGIDLAEEDWREFESAINIESTHNEFRRMLASTVGLNKAWWDAELPPRPELVAAVSRVRMPALSLLRILEMAQSESQTFVDMAEGQNTRDRQFQSLSDNELTEWLIIGKLVKDDPELRRLHVGLERLIARADELKAELPKVDFKMRDLVADLAWLYRRIKDEDPKPSGEFFAFVKLVLEKLFDKTHQSEDSLAKYIAGVLEVWRTAQTSDITAP